MSFLSTILPIFGTTVLPVFLVAACGLLLAYWLPLDGRTLGRVLFYLATPALVLRSLYQTKLDGALLGEVALAVFVITAVSGLLGWLIGADQARPRRSAMALTSAISNNGNMGIPISLFAFGETGAALGTIYYVVSAFLGNTLGVVVASSGHTRVALALRQSLRAPVLYAAFIGLVLNRTGIELPVGIFRSLDLLANAAIPCMLILLGIQLRSVPLRDRETVILRSALVRLLVSPLFAALWCLLLGIAGIERSVLILQAAMPTAVATSVLALEYDAAPRLVAAIIFFTTAASMVSLSVVIWLLS